MPQINLYRKIDSEYMDRRHAAVRVDAPVLGYRDEDGEKVEASVEKDEQKIIEVNKILPEWFPGGCSLEYAQDFHIGNPSALFGEKAVTDSENEIGIAVHIFSRTAMFQETIPLNGVVVDTPEEITLSFRKVFGEDELRGSVKMEFFFYLKSVRRKNRFQAGETGMRLSDGSLFATQLLIDGEGSTFPITQSEVPGGPLWQLHIHWDDPCVDPFNASSVEVELNTKHPMFRQVTGSMDKSSGVARELMEGIIRQAMAMIIFQAVSDMNEAEGNTWKFENAEDGSVLKVVGYWVDVYEVDIDSLSIAGVFNSVQKSIGDKEEEK